MGFTCARVPSLFAPQAFAPNYHVRELEAQLLDRLRHFDFTGTVMNPMILDLQSSSFTVTSQSSGIRDEMHL